MSAKTPPSSPLTPRVFRKDLKPPHLLPALVPEAMWGINLRSLFSRKVWDELREDTYRRAGYTCQVCGSKQELQCNEQWQFIRPSRESEPGIQKLVRLACLCKRCHLVKHLGFAGVIGQLEETIAHMAQINGWSISQAYQVSENAKKDWETNNDYTWKLDK